MRRGEIRVVAGGTCSSKPRPALIVQDDRFDTDSVTVCPMTTTEIGAPLLRMAVPSDRTSGIAQPSFLMVEELITVRRSDVRAHVGRLTAGAVDRVRAPAPGVPRIRRVTHLGGPP